MWCEKTKQGKAKYIERYIHPLTGKPFRVSVIMDKDSKNNRKVAQAALEDKKNIKLKDLLTTTQKRNLTLSELVDLYRESQKLTVAKSTFIRNYHACESLKEILGADTLVDRMAAGYVQKKLNERGEKVGTINERISRLKALLRWGYNNDYVKDVSWLNKLEKGKDEEKKLKLEEKYMESEELSILLSEMSVMRWRMLTELTALSGLRCGEAIALNLSDIDFKNRYIHVTKTYDHINKIVTSPKTLSSNRDVYMQDELLDLCRKIKFVIRKEQMETGVRSDIFLCDIDGDYLKYYAYNKYLKENAERVLHKNVTTHFLRHTHVALMAENGVPLDVISRRLGHADSKVTRDIYFHVTKKMREKDNAQVKDVKIL